MYEDPDKIKEGEDLDGCQEDRLSDFGIYQQEAFMTALPESRNLPYMALGLAGEAGEIANKAKKVIRDNGGELTDQVRQDLKKEIGDVLWYVAGLCTVLDLTLQEVAEDNTNKLKDRQRRDALRGSGDNR